MKYKVDDKVRIKDIDWYNRYTNGTEVNCKYKFFPFSCYMKKYCGQIMTISVVGGDLYNMIEDNGLHAWTDEMIEGLVEEEIREVTDKHYWEMLGDENNNEINLPEGYIFKDENGNVINATKIVLEKKKKEYPKTFVECMHVLEGENRMSLEQMNTFRKLIDARNAYWKIYGEENGLGKPWEPDYTEESYEQGSPIKYVIYYTGTHITKGQKCTSSYILAFPTEEMRDAFFENFKELINKCKKLL